jgi:hypothetical protein
MFPKEYGIQTPSNLAPNDPPPEPLSVGTLALGSL